MKISEMLKEEHVLIGRFLDILNATAQNMENGAEVSDDTLKTIIAFFRDFFVGYHQRKEEEMLFDVLEENGVFREALPIEEMLHDHRKINVLLRRIENLSPSLESETRRKTLIQNIDKFIRALQCHSRREDRVLYPMGDRLISQHDIQKLMDAFNEEEERNREMIEGYVEMAVGFEEKNSPQEASCCCDNASCCR